MICTGCDAEVRCQECGDHLTAPHDTPRTDERAGLSPLEMARLLAALRPGERNAHVASGPLPVAVERIIADRLAAAVARAEAAEALAWDSAITTAYELGWLNDGGERDMLARNPALADVPTSAPTGEAS